MSYNKQIIETSNIVWHNNYDTIINIKAKLGLGHVYYCGKTVYRLTPDYTQTLDTLELKSIYEIRIIRK